MKPRIFYLVSPESIKKNKTKKQELHALTKLVVIISSSTNLLGKKKKKKTKQTKTNKQTNKQKNNQKTTIHYNIKIQNGEYYNE